MPPGRDDDAAAADLGGGRQLGGEVEGLLGRERLRAERLYRRERECEHEGRDGESWVAHAPTRRWAGRTLLNSEGLAMDDWPILRGAPAGRRSGK